MRIATYNLFEGAQDTYTLVKQFVDKHAIDIICIQEANGWQDGNPSKLKDFSCSTGLLHYTFGDSNTRFKLATFSRPPFVNASIITDGFWHAAIASTIRYCGRDLDLWNVHANPQDEESRLKEAEQITKRLGRNAIVMGDINSLSRSDDYPSSLVDKLSERGITKFGNGSLRFDVTDYFSSHGLVDLAAAVHANVPTVPTPANKDMYHAAEMRLDYMFATNGLLTAIKDISVIKDELTHKISDHYPVVLTLG